MKRIVLFAALGVMTACGTPQEMCILRETRDLRTLDRLIAETEGNISRGYAIQEYTDIVDYWGTCYERQPTGADGVRPPPVPYTCRRDREITRTRAVAIDLGAERQKLASMQSKRRDLSRAAEAPIAACRAAHPE
ncbi:MAG: hypothetical protein ACT4OK_04970 [Gemmobacter sp.]